VFFGRLHLLAGGVECRVNDLEGGIGGQDVALRALSRSQLKVPATTSR
jgi:hypothetical protein